jgi:hypothetical protein
MLWNTNAGLTGMGGNEEMLNVKMTAFNNAKGLISSQRAR